VSAFLSFNPKIP